MKEVKGRAGKDWIVHRHQRWEERETGATHTRGKRRKIIRKGEATKDKALGEML